MADKKDSKDEKKGDTIIVKKIIQGGGHHGGAWKVAYADFVTAMMAFFLLLWLLNVSTDEQKNAISNYFDPSHPQVSQSQSGAGGVMGGLSMTPQGAMATKVQDLVSPAPSGASATSKNKNTKLNHRQTSNANPTIEKAKEMMRKEEEKKFKEAEQKIKDAIEKDPELKDLAKNLIIDMTPEGLRIQIVDQDGKPMFPSGSAKMFEKTEKLLQKVAGVIVALPNELSVRGHTDSVPYGSDATYTNWELSSDRANASRRVLLESQIPVTRMNNVMGKADTEHLIKDKPEDPQNRRISIILLKEELTNPDFDKKAEAMAKDMPEEADDSEGAAPQQVPVGTFRKTPGAVQFP
jgi:chemotaxis protein MotB